MAMQDGEFRELIEIHQRMVFSLALRVVGDYGAAEEVAQDVFLELYRTGASLQGEAHIRFWLRRVTVHRATDAWRRRVVRPEASAEEWLEQHTEPDADAQDEGASTALLARLEELLRALPEALRVAIVLRYQEELLPDEIAHLLNQPVATVKSHLQRGLSLLRRKAAVTMKEYVRE